MPLTDAEKKRNQRLRDREAGFTEVNVKVHRDDVKAIRDYALKLRKRRAR